MTAPAASIKLKPESGTKQSAAPTPGSKTRPISLPVSPPATTSGDSAASLDRQSVKRAARTVPSNANKRQRRSSSTTSSSATVSARAKSLKDEGIANEGPSSIRASEKPAARIVFDAVVIPKIPAASAPTTRAAPPPIRKQLPQVTIRPPTAPAKKRANPLPLWDTPPTARQRQALWRDSYCLNDRSKTVRLDELIRADESEDEDSYVVRDVNRGASSTSRNLPATQVHTTLPVIQHPNEPALPAALGFGKFRNPILPALQGSSGSNELDRIITEAYYSESLRVAGDVHIASKSSRNRANLVPEAEFIYSDNMFYSDSVAPPMKIAGCGCVGPCQDNEDCSCSKIQQMYFKHLSEGYGEEISHRFACDVDGTVHDAQFPIFECSAACGCPPSCQNRRIQNARLPEVEIFKTASKGWGVRAKKHLKPGTFIGFYTGELIREEDVDARGRVYDEVGRTYMFDLEGYHLSRPPPGLEKVNSDFARIAYATAEEIHATGDPDGWNAYTIDAFPWGNITRFVNHSCDPNTGLANVYFDDFDLRKPRLALVTRHHIQAGEELTISYSAVEIEDEDVVEDVALIDAAARDTDDEDAMFFGGRRKGKGKIKQSPMKTRTKSSGTTFVKNTKVCYCGARNCRGIMFSFGSAGNDLKEDGA